MKIGKPTLLDLIQLAATAGEDEREQHEAVMGWPWDPERVAHDLYGRIGHKFGLVAPDGSIVAVAGWDAVLDGVWHAWMLASPEAWGEHGRTITRACRRVTDTMFRSEGARRLQTNVLESRTQACRWYEKGLLMKREGTLRGFGVNGENVALYARVKEDGYGRR